MNGDRKELRPDERNGKKQRLLACICTFQGKIENLVGRTISFGRNVGLIAGEPGGNQPCEEFQ